MTIVNSTLSSESAGAKDVAPDDPLLDIEMVFWTLTVYELTAARAVASTLILPDVVES